MNTIDVKTLKFCGVMPNMGGTQGGLELISGLTELTKIAIDKYHNKNFLATKYSSSENYSELNEQIKKNIFKFCAEKANIADMFDLTTKEGLAGAFGFDTFSKLFFGIQTEVLKAVNADNEVEQILLLANVEDVAVGDSKTYQIESKALFPIQENAYGNLTTRFNEQYASPITVVPTPRIAAISFDVTEMVAYNYDFGKLMAKLAMSFRAKMYQEVVDKLFTVANVSSTPFYKAAFAKTTYLEMVERLRGINGAEVTAYGTKIAWGEITPTNGFATQDEINKTGFIGNLYGVRSVILDQAVDSSLPTIPFRVPNDQILLLSNIGDKPIKLVKENSIVPIEDDGRSGSLYRRSYKFLTSWGTGLASQGSYGIQDV